MTSLQNVRSCHGVWSVAVCVGVRRVAHRVPRTRAVRSAMTDGQVAPVRRMLMNVLIQPYVVHMECVRTLREATGVNVPRGTREARICANVSVITYEILLKN